MSLSLVKAKKIIEKLKKHEVSLGRNPNTWYLYENHIYGTAQIAKMIASEIQALNPNKVYIMALLHDICRTEEDRLKRFHGILGYEKLINEDKDVAKICLLHMFPWNKIPNYEKCKELFYNNKKDYDFIINFTKKNKATDEDFLIQLCDNLANKNGFVTIEERVSELIERNGNVTYIDILSTGNELKKYFETKIGHSIYDFFKK